MEENMKLTDTVTLMNSDNYISRFKAEYYQLCIRIKGLSNMLLKMKEGTLDFEPKCSYELLEKQLLDMQSYKHDLELRANIEDIKL